jgi:hypothetical protein
MIQQAARRALEALWMRRGTHSDLVGTTINITSGAWHRTGGGRALDNKTRWLTCVLDAGVGAGIDSYYGTVYIPWRHPLF